MRSLSIALLLLICGTASAVTIDFESVPSGSVPLSFDTQGFTFLTKNREGVGVIDRDYAGTGNAFFFCMDCQNPAGFDMHATDNSLFSLYSFDMGFMEQDPQPLTVTGTYANNSTISITYTSITGFLETLSMGPGWEGLKSVSFEVDTSNNYSFNVPYFDNIVVNEVPVPAAVWLFGSALVGLGWMRRKPNS
jgi:hypothetical protein